LAWACWAAEDNVGLIVEDVSHLEGAVVEGSVSIALFFESVFNLAYRKKRLF
jgi:hypothetical protein